MLLLKAGAERGRPLPLPQLLRPPEPGLPGRPAGPASGEGGERTAPGWPAGFGLAGGRPSAGLSRGAGSTSTDERKACTRSSGGSRSRKPLERGHTKLKSATVACRGDKLLEGSLLTGPLSWDAGHLGRSEPMTDDDRLGCSRVAEVRTRQVSATGLRSSQCYTELTEGRARVLLSGRGRSRGPGGSTVQTLVSSGQSAKHTADTLDLRRPSLTRRPPRPRLRRPAGRLPPLRPAARPG